MELQHVIEGVQVAVIGFSVVLIALILLWLIMIGFSRVLNPGEVRPEASAGTGKESAGAAEASPGGESAGPAPSAEAPTDETDPRLVAAITAAVTMAMSGEDGGRRFRVRSIRPIAYPASPSWKFMGRKAQQEALPRRSR